MFLHLLKPFQKEKKLSRKRGLNFKSGDKFYQRLNTVLESWSMFLTHNSTFYFLLRENLFFYQTLTFCLVEKSPSKFSLVVGWKTLSPWSWSIMLLTHHSTFSFLPCREKAQEANFKSPLAICCGLSMNSPQGNDRSF